MIARSASGSFRDALGTLDQLVAFGGDHVELDDVLEMLGAADAELLFEAVDAVVAEDPKAVLLGVEKMARSGRDPSQFARDLLAHLRFLLVTQTTGEVPTSFVVTATDSARLAEPGGGRRHRHPGPHDRRAGGGADRGPRGRRRADGGGDRAAQSGAARSGPLDRGAAAQDRAAGGTAERTGAVRPRGLSRQGTPAARRSGPRPPGGPARDGQNPRHLTKSPAPAGGAVAGVPRGAEAAEQPSTVGDAAATGPAAEGALDSREAEAGLAGGPGSSCATTAPALAAFFEEARPVGLRGRASSRSAFPPAPPSTSARPRRRRTGSGSPKRWRAVTGQSAEADLRPARRRE